MPYPPSAGNEIRIFKLIRWLRDQGFAVVLLLKRRRLAAEVIAALETYVDRLVLLPLDDGARAGARAIANDGPALARVMRRFARVRDRWMRHSLTGQGAKERTKAPSLRAESQPEETKRNLCPPELVEVARQLCADCQPSVVIAEYIFLSDCLDVAPAGSLRIIDTHDVFSQKTSGVLAHGLEDPSACTPEEERAHLLKSDLVIAIQPREAALLADLVPERPVITVWHEYQISQPLDPSAVVRGRLLVVESDNPLNRHGLQAFLANAWPGIVERCPWATLRVVGKLAKSIEASVQGVEGVGWVEDLTTEYAGAEVVLNPTIAGTGLKIKSVEALSYGKALVAWPNGVDGLAPAEPPAYCVAANWPDFADKVVWLLTNPEERAQLESAALSYASASFSREAVYAPLKTALDAHFTAAGRRLESRAANRFSH